MLIDLDVNVSCNLLAYLFLVKSTSPSGTLSIVRFANIIASSGINRVYDTVEIDARHPVVADCNLR